VLLDVRLESTGVRLSSAYPRTLPDLVPGDELVVSARATGSGPLHLVLHGLQNGKAVRYDATVEIPAQVSRPWVGRLWAKSRTDDLLEEIALSGEQDELKNEVVNLALAYNLVTRYTSFLALPESELTAAARATLDSAREQKRAIQAAHQDAIALSRTDMPPGDPILSVRAPHDAVQVTAFFPFGLVKDLTYDVQSERWQVRFLVPKEVADGVYKARVLIVKKDGEVELAEVPYTIDSTAPEFSAEVSATAGGVEILVSTAEPARQVTAALQSDPRVRLTLTDVGNHLVFKGFLPLPAGLHAVRVVVADKARNESDQLLPCEVRK
jgi:Ca-activated chloride channel family protein